MSWCRLTHRLGIRACLHRRCLATNFDANDDSTIYGRLTRQINEMKFKLRSKKLDESNCFKIKSEMVTSRATYRTKLCVRGCDRRCQDNPGAPLTTSISKEFAGTVNIKDPFGPQLMPFGPTLATAAPNTLKSKSGAPTGNGLPLAIDVRSIRRICKPFKLGNYQRFLTQRDDRLQHASMTIEYFLLICVWIGDRVRMRSCGIPKAA